MKKTAVLFLLATLICAAVPAQAKKTRINVDRENLVEIELLLHRDINWQTELTEKTRSRLTVMLEEMFPQNSMRRIELQRRGERLAAEATAVMVRWDDLEFDPAANTYNLFNRATNLCRFPGFRASTTECTAFLAKDNDRVVTASHCLGEGRCENFAFVFGLTDGSTPDAFARIPAEKVRRCKREIARGPGEHPADGGIKSTDWIVFGVDPVTGIEPLELDTSLVRFGRNILYAGHPYGLASIISEGEVVSRPGDIWRSSFETTLDAMQQSSGSPVFRKRSIRAGRPKVIGILLAGLPPRHYVPDRSVSPCEEILMPCSKRDDGEKCIGPVVLRSSEIAPGLDNP